MIARTFVSKTNTIVNTSDENFGLNPICSLSYGKRVSRVLVDIDVDKIKEKVDDGTYKELSGLTHHLKMTNCGSINVEKFLEKDEMEEFLSQQHRAGSFDIIAFRVPQVWDAGNGFDNSTDTWFLGYKSVSKDGSTWEKSMNGVNWQEVHTASGITYTPGIYSTDFLYNELEKWERGEDSVIVGVQHFDYGNENLNLDITEYVNDVLERKYKNYGICLAFAPDLEETKSGIEHYVNFFGPHTNTFFAPYIETRYNVNINDDRYKFYAGKENRLYFYAVIGGKFVELDELPTCSVDDVEYPVFSETKGIYYVVVKVPKNTKKDTIKYDVWSNLKLDGEEIEDVELEFVVLPAKSLFSLGEDMQAPQEINPVISGINDDQKLNQGDVRELSVVYRIPYTTTDYELVDTSYYRIYVKDGNREIDVIDWEPISVIGKYNSFTIDTKELVPQDYYIDLKVEKDRQTLMFKNQLHFRVVDNVTEIKR